MRHLCLHPFADQGQALGTVGSFQLAAADGSGAAHSRLPDADEGLAVLAQEHEVDVMGAGQLDGVGGHVGVGGNQDALDLVGRDGELFLASLDQETVALLAQAGAEGVGHQLHKSSPWVTGMGSDRASGCQAPGRGCATSLVRNRNPIIRNGKGAVKVSRTRISQKWNLVGRQPQGTDSRGSRIAPCQRRPGAPRGRTKPGISRFE